jgi:hypothetical protein
LPRSKFKIVTSCINIKLTVLLYVIGAPFLIPQWRTQPNILLLHIESLPTTKSTTSIVAAVGRSAGWLIAVLFCQGPLILLLLPQLKKLMVAGLLERAVHLLGLGDPVEIAWPFFFRRPCYARPFCCAGKQTIVIWRV